jgi:hypothetical protein
MQFPTRRPTGIHLFTAMSITPPKSDAGTPQRPAASENNDISLSSPTKAAGNENKDDLMGFSSDEDEDDVKDKKGKMSDDELLSPVTSDIGSDVERTVMESKELEEQGSVRKVSCPFFLAVPELTT